MAPLSLLLILPLTLAHAAVEVTSRNLTELVTEHNAKVAAASLAGEAASARTGSFARSFLPSVALHAGREEFRLGASPKRSQPVYGAEARVNLFNGGRDQIEGQIRNLEVDKRAAAAKRVRAEELQKARAAYWQSLFLQAKKDLIDALLATNDQNLKAAEKRIRSGVATESDRVEFEMQGVELRHAREEAAVAWRAETARLALLLHLPTGTSLSLPEKLAHEHDYETLLRHEEAEHAFLHKENEIRARQESLSARAERRFWWPKVDAFASHQQFNEREREFARAGDRQETAVGVAISLSLAQGLEGIFEASARGKEAAALTRLADFEKSETETILHQEMSELKFLHGQVHAAEENIGRAERYYRLTQSEYNRGVKNSPDVLGASEKLYGNRLKWLQIVRDFQMAKSAALAKLGR